MPYKSEAQRRYLHAKHPEIAARWDAEIRAKKKVAKRMSPEHKLRQQKRLQALTSLTSGTLGLTALAALAAKKPKAAANLTTVGAGVGGTSAFNFASIQNKESKLRGPKQNVYVVRNKKQIKSIKSGLEPVKKGFVMDFGLDDVHQGENIEEIDKAFGLRVGAARHGYAPLHGVKGSANYKAAHAPAKNVRGKHRGEKGGKYAGGHLKGKKLVPVAPAPIPALPAKKIQPATWTPPSAPTPAPPAKQQSSLKPFLIGGAVGGTTIGGGTYLGTKKKLVNKRYSAEGNRRKRLDRYANGATAGATVLGAGAGVTAVRAAQLKNVKYAGAAGGLGLGAIGMDVASHRIRSYKSGKGATYRPLARRPRD